MAAAIINFALEAPVLAASIWSAGAIFYYGPTYVDKVDLWLHPNGTAPIRPTDPSITLDDAKNITKTITGPTHPPPPPIIIKDIDNFTEDMVGPTHPLPPPIISDGEKNVTKNTTKPMHSPTGTPKANNTTFISSAPRFLEAYNITESRRRIFRERTSVYGIPVLRLFALSMIPSVYYYLLHSAGQKNIYAKLFACFLPFGAIIVAGWYGFNPLNLASVTVGTLVDATIFYLGKKWTALGHFHLAFCYLYYWLLDLTIVPLLKAAGSLFLPVAIGLWKFARRHRFIFRTLCLVFATGFIGNIVLFWWSWWEFGPLGTKHYFDTVSAFLKDVTAIYMAIYLFACSWISSTLSSLIQSFTSILSSFKDYVTLNNWPKLNISAWIPTSSVTHVYDDLYNRTEGSVFNLPSRSPDGVNGVWDFVKLVAGGISTTISMGSKTLLHSGSNHVHNFYCWTQNQETFTTVSQVLVWFGALYVAWKFWRWLRGNGGGCAISGGAVPVPPGNLSGPPAGPPIPPPGLQGVPSPPPDNDDGDNGNNSQPPLSGSAEDRGYDGGSDENDLHSPPSRSSGGGDGGDDKVKAPALSPRSFLPPCIVPPRLSPPSSPDPSPPPSLGSSPLSHHGFSIPSSPPEITGHTSPPIVCLTPSEQAAELHRLARAEEDRLAEIERREGAILSQFFYAYRRRKEAAATIKQTYRTYRSNKSLKWWKKTVVSFLVQERERVAEVARLEAECLRKEEEDRAVEAARLEAERLHKAEEERIAEAARLDAENTKAQVHNASVNVLRVDKAEKHAENVARMKALQKGKKKRIRKLQGKKSAAHRKTHEDDEASDNPPTQPPVDGTEDAAITMTTPGTMGASSGHGNDSRGDNDDHDDNNDNGKTSPSGPESRPLNKEKEPSDEKLQDLLDIANYPPPSSEKPSTGINSKKSLRDRLLGGGSVLSRIRRNQGQTFQTDQTGGDNGTSGPSTGGDVDAPRKDFIMDEDPPDFIISKNPLEFEIQEGDSNTNADGAGPGTGPDILAGIDEADRMDDVETNTGGPGLTINTGVDQAWSGSAGGFQGNSFPNFGQSMSASAPLGQTSLPHCAVGISGPNLSTGGSPVPFSAGSGSGHGTLTAPAPTQTSSISGTAILGGRKSEPLTPAVGTINIPPTINQISSNGSDFGAGYMSPVNSDSADYGLHSPPLSPSWILQPDLGFDDVERRMGELNFYDDQASDQMLAKSNVTTDPPIVPDGIKFFAASGDTTPLPNYGVDTDMYDYTSWETQPPTPTLINNYPRSSYQNSIDTSILGASQQNPSTPANVDVSAADGSYAPKYFPYMPKATLHTKGAPSTAPGSGVSPTALPYSPRDPVKAKTDPIPVPAMIYEQWLAKARAIPGHREYTGDSASTKPKPISTSLALVRPKDLALREAWSPSSPHGYDSHSPAPAPSTRPAQTGFKVSNLGSGARHPLPYDTSSPHGYNSKLPPPGPGSALLNGTFSTLQSGHKPAQPHGPPSATDSRPSNIEVTELLKEESEQQKARTSAMLESSPPRERPPPLSSLTSDIDGILDNHKKASQDAPKTPASQSTFDETVARFNAAVEASKAEAEVQFAHITASPGDPDIVDQRRVRREAQARENLQHTTSDDPNEHWGEEKWQPGDDEIYAELETNEPESPPAEEYADMEPRIRKHKKDAAIAKMKHSEQQAGKADGDAEKKQQKGGKLTGEDKMEEELIFASGDAMGDDSDLSSVNSVDSEVRREIEINIIRNKRRDQKEGGN